MHLYMVTVASFPVVWIEAKSVREAKKRTKSMYPHRGPILDVLQVW